MPAPTTIASRCRGSLTCRTSPVKALAASRHLAQQRRRLEPRAELRRVALEPPHDLLAADAIRLVEDAAAERREAEAEEDPDVDRVGIGQDALLDRARHLVEHLQPAALGDV